MKGPGLQWITKSFLYVGLGVLALIFVLGILARMYRKAGPNEALIVYGFRGPRVIKGHGTVIFPMVENCRELSLELMSFDVAPQQDLYTKQGVAVTVEAVAQIKVRSDQASILTAAEQFLTKPPQQREGLIRLVMEGHLRGIIGQLTVEQIVKEPEMVGDRMRGTCADDMSKMGLEVISFTIKEVRDKNEYISNMGRPDVARIKRDAEMATAEAERDTAILRANAMRDSSVDKAQGRPGAGDRRDRVRDPPGRGAARSGHQEGGVRRAEPPPAGHGRQVLRAADQRDAAAGDRRAGEGAAGGDARARSRCRRRRFCAMKSS